MTAALGRGAGTEQSAKDRPSLSSAYVGALTTAPALADPRVQSAAAEASNNGKALCCNGEDQCFNNGSGNNNSWNRDGHEG